MAEPIEHVTLEPKKHAAVAQDGIPRVARYLTTYDDGSTAETQHVLYWDGIVRSMEASAWLAMRGALPADPTQAEIDAALAARAQAEQQAVTDAAARRQAIRTRVLSAVGVALDDLTVGQLKALLAALLLETGALDKDLKVRPPAAWFDR